MKTSSLLLGAALTAQSMGQPVLEKRQFDLGQITGLLGGLGGGAAGAPGGFAAISSALESVGGLPGLIKTFQSINEGVQKAGGIKAIITKATNSALAKITVNAASVENLQPSVRQGAKRIKLRYGPYKIKGRKSSNVGDGIFGAGNFMSLDPAGTSFVQALGEDFPTDSTLLYTTLNVLGEDGKEISIAKGLYPHHVVFFSTSKLGTADYFACKGKAVKTPYLPTFIGAAAENVNDYFADPKSDINTGYYLPKDDKILFQIDVVNYKDHDQFIYLEPEIEYFPGKAAGYLDSDKFILSPGTCDSAMGAFSGTNIRPPPGVKKFAVNGSDIEINRDGYIISSRGHMHDGGVNVLININGKEACNSKAIYGGEGRSTSDTAAGHAGETLAGQVDCPNMIKVVKGDKLAISAYYDLELHPARGLAGEEGGHGHNGGSMGGGMGGMGMGGDGTAEEMALYVIQFSPTGK